jgi:hypothetical protein
MTPHFWENFLVFVPLCTISVIGHLARNPAKALTNTVFNSAFFNGMKTKVDDWNKEVRLYHVRQSGPSCTVLSRFRR